MNTKLRFLLFSLLTIMSVSLWGQTFKVVSVVKDQHTLADDVLVPIAKNGVPCALVTVEIPGLSDVSFDNTFIVESFYDGTLYNLFVAEGMKRIIVRHPDYLGMTVDFSKYDLEVESRHVYHVKLESEGEAKERFLQTLGLSVSPSNAVVMVESTNSGVQTKKVLNDAAEYREVYLPVGEYKYQAVASGHYPVEGTFRLTKEDKKIVPIRMVEKASGQKAEPEQPVQIVYLPQPDAQVKKEEPKTQPKPQPKKRIEPQTRNTVFYLEPTLMTIDYLGAGLNMGIYKNKWNVEAGVIWSLSASEMICWKDESGREVGAYTYKPTIYNVKLGYTINNSETFKVTPQVGFAFLKNTATYKYGDTNLIADGSNSLGLMLDCKLAYRCSDRFGLFATPQYGIRVARSTAYPILADASSKINHWNNSFGLNLGFTLFLY